MTTPDEQVDADSLRRIDTCLDLHQNAINSIFTEFYREHPDIECDPRYQKRTESKNGDIKLSFAVLTPDITAAYHNSAAHPFPSGTMLHHSVLKHGIKAPLDSYLALLGTDPSASRPTGRRIQKSKDRNIDDVINNLTKYDPYSIPLDSETKDRRDKAIEHNQYHLARRIISNYHNTIIQKHAGKQSHVLSVHDPVAIHFDMLERDFLFFSVGGQPWIGFRLPTEMPTERQYAQGTFQLYVISHDKSVAEKSATKQDVSGMPIPSNLIMVPLPDNVYLDRFLQKGTRPTSATLLHNKQQGRLEIAIHFGFFAKKRSPKNILAFDRGLVNILTWTLLDGETGDVLEKGVADCLTIRRLRDRTLRRIADKQRRGKRITKSDYRVKATEDELHKLAVYLVKLAIQNDAYFVAEKLTKSVYQFHLSKSQMGKIYQYLDRKCEENGLPNIATILPAWTSQTHICGYSAKTNHLYYARHNEGVIAPSLETCLACGANFDGDLNAAEIIGLLYLEHQKREKKLGGAKAARFKKGEYKQWFVGEFLPTLRRRHIRAYPGMTYKFAAIRVDTIRNRVKLKKSKKKLTAISAAV